MYRGEGFLPLLLKMWHAFFNWLEIGVADFPRNSFQSLFCPFNCHASKPYVVKFYNVICN